MVMKHLCEDCARFGYPCEGPLCPPVTVHVVVTECGGYDKKITLPDDLLRLGAEMKKWYDTKCVHDGQCHRCPAEDLCGDLTGVYSDFRDLIEET